MGPTWGPPGFCRPHMGPMLAPGTLLSGMIQWNNCLCILWSLTACELKRRNYFVILKMTGLKLVKHKISWVSSQDEVRQQYLNFKGSEGVFGRTAQFKCLAWSWIARDTCEKCKSKQKRNNSVVQLRCRVFTSMSFLNTLRPRQNGRHFADDIFKCIFLNENIWIPIKISVKFVPKGPINNIPALVQIMAWRRPGDKPLSELMMVSLTTHICVTRPQWVKYWWVFRYCKRCGFSHLLSLILPVLFQQPV